MNNRIKNFINSIGYSSDDLRENVFLYDYVFEISGEKLIGFIELFNDEEEELKYLHKKFWNYNEVPISVIFTPNSIKILNNYHYNFDVALMNKNEDMKIESIINKNSFFTGKLLNLLEKTRKNKNRIDEVLLDNLEQLSIIIQKKSELPYETVSNSLIWCIFIKYLEDRHILTNKTFVKFGVNNFVEVLEKGLLNEFSEYINDKLMGDLSDICDFSFETSNWSKNIAEFFKGDDVRTRQTSLFTYDFSIIPVELISNIYERFLNLIQSKIEKKRTGNFYTPYSLAEYMINSSFEKNKNIKRVLDPSCGSGVFLVSAFKKMCTLELDDQEKENILTKQIYGVDLNRNALKIATLSLYIAYLDSIDPKDIEISNKTLPKLIDNNLIFSDFFENELVINDLRFDLVIGNPPWYSIGGKHLAYSNKKEYIITDNQIAQSFIYKSLELLSETGSTSLIVTNSILYGSRANKFRNCLFNINFPSYIINLQNLKMNLFASAKAPASIINFDNSNKNKNLFGYYLYEDSLLSQYTKKIFFNSSKTRFHPIELFKKKPEFWELISYATQFDMNLLEKMNEYKSVGYYFDKYELIMSQGFSVPSTDFDVRNQDLAGLPLYKGNSKKLTDNKYYTFERIHDKRIYFSENKLLISRTISNRKYKNVVFTDRLKYKCVFNNKYYAVIYDEYNKSNYDYELILNNLQIVFESKIYLYYQYFVSDAWKSTHPEIRMERIKKYPIPEEIFIKKITEEDLYKLYALNNNEINVINETYNIYIKKIKHKSSLEYENNYLNTIKDYFYELADVEFSSKVIKDLFFLKIHFYEGNEITTNNIKNIDDSYGILSIKDVENKIITNSTVIEFTSSGFNIVKSKDIKNFNTRAAFDDINQIIKLSFQGDDN